MSWSGDDRFRIVRALGRGTFGTVYEVEDRERRERVALKVLEHDGAASLLRFKSEFRTLANVVHPNVVRLHELFADGSRWFFTMELVEGVDLVRWVRGAADDAEPTVDLARLCAAFSRLAQGLAAVHAQGLLHRDLKPANVLVSNEGRVVIVDFGLALDMHASATTDGRFAGTPAYMAPEQVVGDAPTAASDWYAVGVMLFELLTGRLPFEGTPIQVVSAKAAEDAPAPRSVAPDVPEALDALCVSLLRRSPTARATGADVIAALTRPDSVRPPPRPRPSTDTHTGGPFVGRKANLELLRAAWKRAQAGETGVVAVVGPSGVGKSALIRRFVDDVAATGSLVLAGQCYERESVPFKGLDLAIDALTHHLRRLPPDRCASFVPTHLHALTMVFPALSRVQAFRASGARPLGTTDPQRLRTRAFGAARELFARLTAEAPLVLAIDDVQWSDADGARLLAELLAPPDAPAMLVVLGARTNEPTADAMLAAIAAAGGPAAQTIELGTLSDGEALELARALLQRTGETDDELAARIAAEAGGSPLFLGELAHWVQGGGARADGATVRLETLLADRIRNLGPAERALLRVLAISAAPMRREIAWRASELSASAGAQAVGVLRMENLVRARVVGTETLLECQHDRVRDVACAELDEAATRAAHRAIAAALEEARADAEQLAAHLVMAGQPERAIEHVIEAARRAAAALAFQRAGRLYELAASLLGEGDPRRRAIVVALGDALANAGHGARAADAFLAAIDGAGDADRLELHRRAAEQLLQSGHVDRGLAMLSAVLEQVGLALPRTPLRALVGLFFVRLWLALRGLRWSERDTSAIAALDLTRIDACWSVASGLAVVDHIRGTHFQTRHTILALGTGEPRRVCRALIAEAGFRSVKGASEAAGAAPILNRAKALADRLEGPWARAQWYGFAGIAAYFASRWRRASELLTQGTAMMRDQCSGLAWEANASQSYAMFALYQLGELRELSRQLPALLRDAEDRGDLFFAANLTAGYSHAHWLARDDVATGRACVEATMARWSRRAFHVQHWFAMRALTMSDLYDGDTARALARLDEGFEPLRRSLLLRLQTTRAFAHHLLGGTALAVLRAGGAPSLRTVVERQIRVLSRERLGWIDGVADTLRAGLALHDGDAREGAARLASAAKRFDEWDMRALAEAARLRRATVLGDEREANAAEEWMRAQGVVDADRFSRALLPGTSHGRGARAPALFRAPERRRDLGS